MKGLILFFCCSYLSLVLGCAQSTISTSRVICGDEQLSEYLPLMEHKRVAVVANHTSVVNGVHLVDTLLSRGMSVVKVFAPEHGFRGAVPAGERIDHEIDAKTGLKIVSLYGQHVAPDSLDLADVDIVLFDIQDVGVRFYTYLTTMKYVMESCNRFQKKMIILDRPNPNGHYIDGPILDLRFKSMVGAIPIPVVHGCTLGELAKMILGEQWLSETVHAELFTVIPCKNYFHDISYSLNIPPSPNLSSDCAIQWYPSLCFFEGTSVSVGRGTSDPFTCYGYPGMGHGDMLFTPVSMVGKVQHPPFENELCQGMDLRKKCGHKVQQLDLSFLLSVHHELGDKMFTSPSFFDKLAGSDELRKAIVSGETAEGIRSTWNKGLEEYKSKRKMYLLYP